MIYDVSKLAEKVIAKRTPKGETLSGPVAMKNESSRLENGEVDGQHVASEDLVAAINEKSPQRVREALKNFMDLHSLSGVKDT